MKRLLCTVLPLSTLACAQAEADGSTLRTAILLGAGVLAVVLLILFGKPNKQKNKPSEKE